MSPSPRLPAAAPAAYAELHCLSSFSFLRGASSAEELFARAKKLGYAALAITDECSLAGAVRALVSAEAHDVKLIVGSEVLLDDGLKLVLLVCDASGYTDLCRLISRARRRGVKGSYALERSDLTELGTGVLVLWLADARARDQTERLDEQAQWLAERFRGRLWIAVELHRGSDDAARLAALTALGARHELPLVATGDVHMHLRRRRALQDVLTATRLRCTLAQAGHALFANGERHLRRIEDLCALYPAALLAETLRIAAACRFSLRGLDYRYPDELVPIGRSAIEHLRELTWRGARALWPQAIPADVHAQLERELLLIEQLRYEHFFLTVEDIVRWARTREPPILCQGRGSSANSAVCYCLGITAVTPENGNLLFERFLSKERDEPPDIDVDFEHERREEVIQYIYAKYGRERAALAATVIRYRGRSALRDVGRALGFADEQIALLTAALVHARGGGDLAAALRERGFDPDSRNVQRLFALADELRGFPRHLSQHVGGFVISQAPLHELVPVENAAMPARTIIQWDKDDLEEMRLLKVDVLALGMLSALRKCLTLLHAHELWTLPCHGARPGLHDIPAPGAEPSNTAVFDMICAADTVGVFQIESRAQMSMLPRLKPRNFHDLVVQIAIVRPGPIQGDMVHPYLRRRQGLEAVTYPQSRFELEAGHGECAIRDVLARTLGVPIFQEQVMKLMQVVAGFTPGEADQLRRAMAAWKHAGDLEPFRDKIRAGMLERGYEEAYFERLFAQIKGFGAYGFPESHSASFANLAWASCWLKHFHPAAWTCALLNSQPMGFYAPAQLVQDARRHGVRVLPVDVCASQWDCTLESLPTKAGHARHTHALRLGLRQVKGIGEALAQRIVAARAQAAFAHLADFCARACVSPAERARLADANALRSLSGHRHRARWDSAGIDLAAPLFASLPADQARVVLPVPTRCEDVLGDYATLGLSLQAHPLALIRAQLRRRRVLSAAELIRITQTDLPLRCAGLVTVRQRPLTANGVTFLTLEDETGTVNVVIWQALAQRQTRILLEATILLVDGVLQLSGDGVRHLVARRLHDGSAWLPALDCTAREFH